MDIRITAGISFSNKNNKLITADIALQSTKKIIKILLSFMMNLINFKNMKKYVLD